MANAPLKIDARQFLRGLSLADQRVRLGARRGTAMTLGRAKQLANDRVPVDQSGRKPGGTLQRSIVAHVDRIEATSAGVHGVISAGGGEAGDYAIRQHEDVLHHTHPVEGAYASKYIEMPLKELDRVFPELLASQIMGMLG